MKQCYQNVLDHSKIATLALFPVLRPSRSWVLLALLLTATMATSQDIEKVAKAKPIKVTGHLSAGEQYMADSRFDLEQTFAFNISAGLNFSFFENFNIPIEFMWSNQQVNINRPQIRFFGLSPSYKWVTLHGGYRTYNLSPYMMNNRYVLGGGIDLRPGKLRLSVFYGDLVQDFNLLFHASNVAVEEMPMYRRRAMGGRFGFGSDNNFFEITAMRIIDDPQSGNQVILDSLEVNPMANFALGYNMSWRIFKTIRFGSHGVASAVTFDQNADGFEVTDNYQSLFNFGQSLLPINISSRVAFAYDAFIETQIKSATLRFRYEHIDPNYTSLGLHFIQSDVDNYLVDIRSSFLKSRLNVFGSFGLQYTNTLDVFETRDERIIVNASVSYAPTNRLSLNVNYNNFNSTGNISVVEFVDSLKLTNTSETFSFNANYNLGKKGIAKHSINFNGSLNTFSLIQGEVLTNENQSQTFSTGYNFRTKKTGWSFGTNVQYQQFAGMEQPDVARYGLGASIRKRVGKKVNISLLPSYNLNYTNALRDGSVVNVRGNVAYTPAANHSFMLSLSAVNRTAQTLQNFTQTRLALQYNARF